MEIAGSRFVWAFHIVFENLHRFVLLVLKCNPDNDRTLFLTGTMANLTILQPSCVRSMSFPKKVIPQSALIHYPANHADSRLSVHDLINYTYEAAYTSFFRVISGYAIL
jgi:hypothetical protein